MKRFLARVLALGALAASTALVAPAGAVQTPDAVGATYTCGIAGTGASWRVVTSTSPCHVDVVVGTSVPLKLSASFRWTKPHSTSDVVKVTSLHPSTGGLTGLIVARHLGNVTLGSAGVMACAKGNACPDLAMLWTLRVTVVKHLPAHS